MQIKLFPGDFTLLQKIGFISGPLLGLLTILFFKPSAGNPRIGYTAGIVLFMSIWWITEAVPLAITALMPVALFPFFSIMNGKDVSGLYFNDVIFLFLGGFMMALAMERWNLHRRIAMITLTIFGTRPAQIMLGFMLVTAFLSMWISNTATTMMMVPIAVSVLISLESTVGKEQIKKYSVGLLLGVAYSASVGGIATLIGTPPNAAFVKIFAISFPDAPEVSFSQWFIFALPVSIFFLFMVWGLLSFLFCRITFRIDKNIFRKQYKELGKMVYEEKVVFILFVILALMWLTRANVELGKFTIPGWSSLFPHPEYIKDGVVAILIASFLYILPARQAPRILEWESVRNLPWGIVILFGGGFALAGGFKESGLSDWIGGHLYKLQSLSDISLIASVSALSTLLSELTSNTATTQMILPILAAVSESIGKNPLLLMVPATLASSFAFMMPVSTPPNAIIFGTGRLKIIQMVKVGVILYVLGTIVITIGVLLLGSVMGIHTGELPAWAG